MAVRPYNVSPYFDDYDPAKNYVQILAVAGKAEQSREFTQSATMYRDFIGRLGDAIFKDGSVISGCNLVIDEDTVTITTGRIYYDGLVRIINEDVVIPITGV